jgi:hypothetical protein
MEAAHRWVRRAYPHLDAAVVAGWAADAGKAMGNCPFEQCVTIYGTLIADAEQMLKHENKE